MAKKNPKLLTYENLRSVGEGDLIRIDIASSGSPWLIDALVMYHSEVVSDFLTHDTAPGLILYGVGSQRKFQFTYRVLTQVWKTYLVSRL